VTLPELLNAYRFPKEPPAVPAVDHGWLSPEVEEMLSCILCEHMGVVVELGSWLGKSTRFIADHAPTAVVIAVDHWKGSREHHLMTDVRAFLPVLYETFLRSCWEYRDRIVPLRMNTVDGLTTIDDYGVQPHVIYIDASHEYQEVLADIELSLMLFPNALLCGDDWRWEGVRRAVTEVTKAGRMMARTKLNVWWRESSAFEKNLPGSEVVA